MKTKTRRILLVFGLVFLLTAAAGCGAQEKDQKENKADSLAGKGLTEFTSEDIYGAEINQDIFKDYDLTMINVWGTFCNPCVEEMPFLGELQKEYEPKGINIVGIVTDVQDNNLEIIDSQIDLARKIAEETGADYTHLTVTQEMIDAKLGELDAIPASFFVDSKGNIVGETYVGARSKEEWAGVIDETYQSLIKEQ